MNEFTRKNALSVKCNHCQIAFKNEIMIEENNLFFCCKGCQSVYYLLQDEDLGSFYNKLGSKTLASVKKYEKNDLNNFDEDSFFSNYVKETQEGFSHIDLIIEGIHCAACIWLNEKILFETDGIIEAKINFTNNKARIIFDKNEIKLSSIISKIRSIGYDAYAYEVSLADENASEAKKDYFIRMMVAVFSSVNIMMLGVAKYTGFFTGIDDDIKHMIHMAEFILCTPVLFYSGSVFFKGAYYALKNKIINMDFLVCSGAGLSYVYSLYILLGGAGESYFDSVSMIITFVLVGKYLEVIGKKSALDTLDTIKSKVPLFATLVKKDGKKVVAIAEIKVGDVLELKTGEQACVDGELLAYESSFDEAALSGESLSVDKKEKDPIYSSSINLGSLIQYKALKTYEKSTLNSIVVLLEDSLNHKPKIEEKANEFSKVFSLLVLGISLGTFFTWYFLGLSMGFSYGNISVFEKSFIVAISVIVIACPCALALATPMASLIGISSLAKKGLLFKEAKYIEEMAKADVMVLDKTGTLTNGLLSVKDFKLSNNNIFYLNLMYSLVDSSTHPISKALKKYLEEKYSDLEYLKIDKIKNINGKGLSAFYENIKKESFELLGGSSSLLKEHNISTSFKSSSSEYIFCINKEVFACVTLEDELKDDAKDFIAYTKKNNIKTVILSGDNINVVKKIAKELDIKEFYGNINPIEKANYIKGLKEQNKRVIMVGDGVNDALALSYANVSIVMKSGTDIAISVSDIVILNNSLKALKDALILSKRTYFFIKQNLLISLVYNMITIPLAVFGLVIPLVAALSMSLSSLIVVLNSLRIKNKG